MKVVINWQLSSYFGWGVYGINMALEWAKRPDIEAQSAHIVQLGPGGQVHLDRLRLAAIDPFVRRTNLTREIPSDAIWFQALGNQFLPDYHTKIGVCFFEEPLLPEAVERAKRYDILIAGSTWNEEVLRGHGLTNVRTLIQGADRSLFHPAPRKNLFPGRFLIFSGGKAEPRKGQDIVVRAFRIFAKRHPEAVLVTAWHSPWPQLRQGMDLDLSEFADRVIDVGPVPNGLMAPIYRECHVGLFPNRCEGGTNLVAMEAIACGVPTIVSACTGHMDLVRLAPVRQLSVVNGEPNVEEAIHHLETAFDGAWSTHGYRLPDWFDTADGLLAAAREVSSQ
jgi:glycosyltransferase involved in cell wall biosynthesis